MNRADAISDGDLDGGEPDPLDCCIDCGAAILVGWLRCADCEIKHEEFTVNADDPRRG